MKYKVVQKRNPSNPTAPQKWYANSVNQGTISVQQLARDIAGRSSLTRGDIMNVIENLLDEIPKYLVKGNSVSLGDFCSLRLSISSKGSDTEEEFSIDMIEKIKVIFTPSTQLKKEISDIHFEKAQK